jgi:crystallin alpha B
MHNVDYYFGKIDYFRMSIVPLMFRDWWEEFDRPASRLIDQHFGSGLSRDDLLTSFSSLGLGHRSRPVFTTPGYYRPWRTLARQNSGGASTIQCDKDKFEVSIRNCYQFLVLSIETEHFYNHIILSVDAYFYSNDIIPPKDQTC